MIIDEKDIEAIEEEVTKQVSDDLANFLAGKSRSPKMFYLGLSTTIYPSGNDVVTDVWLCKWIMESRGLTQEFIDTNYLYLDNRK
jgi:hypothetical protein